MQMKTPRTDAKRLEFPDLQLLIPPIARSVHIKGGTRPAVNRLEEKGTRAKFRLLNTFT